MKKLKIRFWQIENVVAMKVLVQDEKLRGKGEIFNNDLEMTICSNDYPAMTFENIFIRGNVKGRDNEVSCTGFSSIEDATAYIKRCQKLISDYNASLEEEEDEVEMIETFTFE